MCKYFYTFVLMDSEKKDIIGCIDAKQYVRTSPDQAQRLYGISGIFTTGHSLNYSELYSGTDKDPINWAHLDAERFAVDDFGNKLPYDVTISLQALNINKPLELMSRKCRQVIMRTQILMVHVVVFSDQKSKDMYDLAGVSFIKEQ